MHIRSTASFSLHIEAERKGFDTSNLSRVELNAAERSLLQKFYSFAKKHEYHVWVHWCMRNSTYGFEALESRFAILSGKSAPKLRAQKKLDLSSLLADLYGPTYESSEFGSKLIAALKRNRLHSGGIMSGNEEACAYVEKNYQAIMRSNQNKAEAIGLIIEAAGDNKLKTAASVSEIYGLNVLGVMLYVGDNYSKLKKIASGISSFFGIVFLWNTDNIVKFYKYVEQYLNL